MGGPGSGRWYRWRGTRTTLDAVSRLDVRWLHRHGYLAGRPYLVTWHRGDQRAGSIGVACQPDGVVLTYDVRVGGGAWTSVRQVVPLAWTPCHYGGERPWFRCGGCQRRVAVLCLDGQWFLCRHCSALPYGSQQETAQDRRYRKVRKIRDRLGVSGNLMEPVSPWRKPKSMHWRTWERLRQQEEQVHGEIFRVLARCWCQ